MYTAIVIFSLVGVGFGAFDLTLLHTNDVHDRMEQFDRYGGTCNEEEARFGECYGGFARMTTKVNEIRETAGNVLFVDAGDQFQGTNWFVHYKGVATSYFMNKVGYDVQAIGNHEFDLGPEGLEPFLRDVNFPQISCNIDASKEPIIDGLFNKSVVLTAGGEEIGVVGYTYSRSNEISATGRVIFTDEIEALQAEVDVLISQGINKVIAVGHSGITKDLEIATKVEGVDIVVGGHSDTFLYTGDPPDVEIPYGEYPTVVTPDRDTDGTVLVVTDYTFAKYLGRLDVTFDNDGRVTQWSGNPIHLDSGVQEDPDILAEINEWGEVIANLSSEIVGSTHVLLDGSRSSCRLQECNVGNMITDAYIWSQVTFPDDIKWNDVSIAIQNSGSIRSSIVPGEITYGDITLVLPYGNTIDTLELEGRYIREMLENSVWEYDSFDPHGRFLQFSGILVKYDVSRDPYDRVVDVLVRCTKCTVPEYVPLDDDEWYKMVLPRYIATGGDGYSMISENARNHYSGNLDVSVISEYIERFSPIYAGLERRITFSSESFGDAASIKPKITIIAGLLFIFHILYLHLI